MTTGAANSAVFRAEARPPRLFRKQPVPDVAGGGGQAQAAWFAPDRAVDFVFIANLEPAGHVLGDEDGVAHLPARPRVLGFDLFPEAQPTQLELRQLLLDLTLEAVLFAFTLALAAARKHPATVPPPSDEENAPAFCGDQLG